MWILLGLLAFSLTNVRGWIRSVVLEWLPFALVLWLYDLLRGQADTLLFSAHVRPQLRAEELLFGGTVPTVWLQQPPLARLRKPGVVRLRHLARLRQLLPGHLPDGRLPLVLRAEPLPSLRRHGLAPRPHGLHDLRPLPGRASVAREHVRSTRTDVAADRRRSGGTSPSPTSTRSSRRARNTQTPSPRSPRSTRRTRCSSPSRSGAWRPGGGACSWSRIRGRWRLPSSTSAEHYFVDVLLGWAYALIGFWVVNRLADRLAARRSHRHAEQPA